LIQFTKIISFKNIFEIIKEIDYFGIPLLAIGTSVEKPIFPLLIY